MDGIADLATGDKAGPTGKLVVGEEEEYAAASMDGTTRVVDPPEFPPGPKSIAGTQPLAATRTSRAYLDHLARRGITD